MKAIQVKYLGATNTKGSRLKCWAYGDYGIVEPVNYEMEMREQAKLLAERYAKEMFEMGIYGFGVLPNGDYVATLGAN